jgi:hypothetical protein
MYVGENDDDMWHGEMKREAEFLGCSTGSRRRRRAAADERRG